MGQRRCTSDKISTLKEQTRIRGEKEKRERRKNIVGRRTKLFDRVGGNESRKIGRKYINKQIESR